jgi:hypothetical protein
MQKMFTVYCRSTCERHKIKMFRIINLLLYITNTTSVIQALNTPHVDQCSPRTRGRVIKTRAAVRQWLSSILTTTHRNIFKSSNIHTPLHVKTQKTKLHETLPYHVSFLQIFSFSSSFVSYALGYGYSAP